MKHLFIINPAAGKKESTAYLEGLLKQLPFPHEVEYTRGAGDARRITEAAAGRGELGPHSGDKPPVLISMYAGGDAGVHPGTHHVDAQPATVRLSEKKVNFFYPEGAGWTLD